MYILYIYYNIHTANLQILSKVINVNHFLNFFYVWLAVFVLILNYVSFIFFHFYNDMIDLNINDDICDEYFMW